MPVKMARSPPRPSFGVATVMASSAPPTDLAKTRKQRQNLRRAGSHLGNPVLES
jgi:hypothetical protein